LTTPFLNLIVLGMGRKVPRPLAWTVTHPPFRVYQI
jgi:hypothetical protein